MIVVIRVRINYAMFVTVTILSAGKDTQSVKVILYVIMIFRM